MSVIALESLTVAWLVVLMIGEALGIDAAGWIVALALAVSVASASPSAASSAWRAARMDDIKALRHE